MRFSSDPTEKNHIRWCEPGAVHVGDRKLESHFIISADEIFSDWNPPAIEALSINDFQLALDLKPDVILFGTGTLQRFPHIAVLTDIMRSGVAIEVMDTVAACRTFTVLISEKRAVVAALLVEHTA
jgi:uncharacterized protein